jgi:hypothetical protein
VNSSVVPYIGGWISEANLLSLNWSRVLWREKPQTYLLLGEKYPNIHFIMEIFANYQV